MARTSGLTRALVPTALACMLFATAASAQGQPHLPFRIPGGFGGGGEAQATPFELAIGRGDQALRRGDWATATREFETAARLDARDARPEFYLGEVEMRQSHWPAAEAHYRNAIRVNPRMAEAHAELGAVLREQSRGPDALTELETATRLEPQLPEAHFTLALALEDAGQAERATGEYRRAVQLAPDNPMPALNLGILLANQHPAAGTAQRAEALRMLQASVRASHNDRAVLAGAGPALRVLGEPALAADVLERARAQGQPTPALLGELAQAQWAAGNRPQALARIDEAVHAAPDSPELRYVHALMLAGQGDRAAAAAELRTVVRLGNGSALAQRAQEHLSQISATPSRR